jgi:uncharacterized repeat protein (TIGR02543 family)
MDGNGGRPNWQQIAVSGMGRNLNDFAVDYAENLYVIGSTGEMIRAFAMPYCGEKTTTARKEFTFSFPLPPVEKDSIAWHPYPKGYTITNQDLWEQFAEDAAGKALTDVLTAETSAWKWLGDYVAKVSEEQGISLTNDPAADGMEASWRYAVHNFFNCAPFRDSWPKAADFSTAGKPEAWGGAYQKAHGGTQTETKTELVEVELPSKITAEYVIPTPVKDNDEFIGWYDTNDNKGNKLTVLPVGYDGTVYAIWKSMLTSTDVEQVVRPVLDVEAPMYDILGRPVNHTYHGIVIQNGNIYFVK